MQVLTVKPCEGSMQQWVDIKGYGVTQIKIKSEPSFRRIYCSNGTNYNQCYWKFLKNNSIEKCFEILSREYIPRAHRLADTRTAFINITKVTFFFNCTNNQKYSYVTMVSVSRVTYKWCNMKMVTYWYRWLWKDNILYLGLSPSPGHFCGKVLHINMHWNPEWLICNS